MTRKIKHILYFIVCCFLTACGESSFDGSEVAGLSGRYLKISQTSLAIESSAGSSASIEVECVKNAWQVSDLPSWLASTPQKGTDNTIVTISATEENNSADNIRTCLFRIESAENDWNYSIPINITQARSTPFLICNPEGELVLKYEAHSEQIKVAANCSWSLSKEDAEWFNCTKMQDGNIIVNVEENRSNMSRTGYIYLKADNYSTTSTIRIIQNISNITSTTDNIEVDNHGGDYSLTISSETSWTAICGQSWVSVTPQNGNAGVTDLHISVSPNGQNSQRTAYIYINVGDVQRICIPIVQERTYVRPLKSSISIPSTGGSVIISIKANDAWTISPSYDTSWLSFSVMSGSNNGETTLTATNNNSANFRSTEVKFSTTLGVDYNLPVTQDGRFLIVRPETAFFSKNGGDSDPIDVETDGSYDFEASESWITCRTGAIEGKLIIGTAQNDGEFSREGYVRLRLTDLTDGSELYKDIRVYQMGNHSSSFFINRFSDDEKDWNFYNDANISITLKGFSTNDNNWNPK